MRLYTTITAIIVLFMSSMNLSAQDVQRMEGLDLKGVVRDYIRAGRTSNKSAVRMKRFRSGENLPFEKIGLSVNIGTNDFGIKLSTPINDKFKIRIGGGYMPEILGVKKTIAVNDESLRIRSIGYQKEKNIYPDYKVEFKPTFFNGHILVDYYPVETVPFHITAGIYVGESKFKATGFLVNPAGHDNPGERLELAPWATWPILENVEGYALNIEDGILDVDVKMGFIVKPYVGVGYGYVVPNSAWSFNFDAGVMYQGEFKVHQFGKEAPKTTTAEMHYESSAINIKKYINKVKFWPSLNFQVTYRIK